MKGKKRKAVVKFIILCLISAVLGSMVLTLAIFYLLNVVGFGLDFFQKLIHDNCSKKKGPEKCRQFENRISVASLGIILGGLQIIASITHLVLRRKQILFSLTHILLSGIGLAAVLLNTDVKPRSRTVDSPDVEYQLIIDATFVLVGIDAAFCFVSAMGLAIIIMVKE